MTGTGLTIKGHKDVSRRFSALAVTAADVTDIWPIVGKHISGEVRKQFTTKGAYLGRRPWKPLKARTVREKVAAGYPKAPLVRTGKLKRSFTKRPMDIEVYGPKSARFGSSEKTAVWHQKGTKRHGKRVNPPRPMLIATRKMRADVRDIIAKELTGKRRP